jgi:hypothetical protein
LFHFWISLNDFVEFGDDEFADLGVAFALGLVEFLDHRDDPIEHLGTILLGIAHEVPQFLIFGPGDHKLVAIFQEKVELLGEFGVGQQSMADFEVTIILIISALVFP